MKFRNTRFLERLIGENTRRAHVLGIYWNEASIRRPVEALLRQPYDERAIQKLQMGLEPLAAISENLSMATCGTGAGLIRAGSPGGGTGIEQAKFLH